MRLILLAGYKSTSGEEAPWLKKENGFAKLEARLQEAKLLFREKIVVLGGESADESLLRCPSIETAELVFDTNTDALNILSNLRSALKLGIDPAIILPADLSFGDIPDLKALIAHTVQHGVRADFHIVQRVSPSGELSNYGFPLILTLRGCNELVKNKTLTGLADPQLVRELVPTRLASIAVHP